MPIKNDGGERIAKLQAEKASRKDPANHPVKNEIAARAEQRRKTTAALSEIDARNRSKDESVDLGNLNAPPPESKGLGAKIGGWFGLKQNAPAEETRQAAPEPVAAPPKPINENFPVAALGLEWLKRCEVKLENDEAGGVRLRIKAPVGADAEIMEEALQDKRWEKSEDASKGYAPIGGGTKDGKEIFYINGDTPVASLLAELKQTGILRQKANEKRYLRSSTGFEATPGFLMALELRQMTLGHHDEKGASESAGPGGDRGR